MAARNSETLHQGTSATRAAILALTACLWVANASADNLCTVNYEPVECADSFYSGAHAAVFRPGPIVFPQSYDLQYAVGAAVETSVPPPYALEDVRAASASTGFTSIFYTAGPVRVGFADYALGLDGDGSGGAGRGGEATISAGPGCNQATCTGSGSMVPFTLGVPYTITLRAFASADDYYQGSEVVAFVGLSLFEKIDDPRYGSYRGNPVPILFGPPPVSVPEPASSGIAGAAIIGAIMMRKRFNRMG